jgi:hypothetical protein
MRCGFGRTILVTVAIAGCTGSVGPSGGNNGNAGGGLGSGGGVGTGNGATGASSMAGGPGGTATQPGAMAGNASGGAAATGAAGAGTATAASCASAPMASGIAYIRRLTGWEYVNTIADVLGVTMTPDMTNLLPADIHANGFSNDAAGQLATLDAATAYQQTADAVGAALSKTTGWLGAFATCAQTVASCRDSVVQALGLRLFRRPTTAAETASFGALFDTAVTAGLTMTADAAVVVVRAMLQSPQFLYRLEDQVAPMAAAAARPLDSYEIASRLSYWLWSSAPDMALLSAAQSGQLTAPDQRAAQVTRMLALPRARAMAQRYFREWLFLDDLDQENRGPAFTPQLAADMKAETLADVGDQLWDKAQPLLSLFTTQTTIVTPGLAKYYGLAAPGPDGRYSTMTIPGRMGFLTHAGVLLVNGQANASIVQRGLFMLRNVLCEDVPAPPPGATSVVLAPPTASLRQQSDARLMTEPCKSCHGIFDPLAYAFESFDNMGGWQTKDINGNAVRQDGWLTVTNGMNEPYMTIADYMPLLTKDSRVSACIASRTTQFAWGRPMSSDDQCMMNDITARMNATPNKTFADLVTAVATSPYFVYTAVQ